SLSCARPGASALNRPSASPKLAPKVRQSQRGMIASIEWLRVRVTLALRVGNSADRGLHRRVFSAGPSSATCYLRAPWPRVEPGDGTSEPALWRRAEGRESSGVEGTPCESGPGGASSFWAGSWPPACSSEAPTAPCSTSRPTERRGLE